MEDKLWEQVAVFHGHKCPGLAIGYKVSLLALKHLDIKDDINDEDIVCIAETDACGVDAGYTKSHNWHRCYAYFIHRKAGI